MGGSSIASSVVALDNVSARSFPTMLLCPGAHAMSMWLRFEDSRNKTTRRVWRLMC